MKDNHPNKIAEHTATGTLAATMHDKHLAISPGPVNDLVATATSRFNPGKLVWAV